MANNKQQFASIAFLQLSNANCVGCMNMSLNMSLVSAHDKCTNKSINACIIYYIVEILFVVILLSIVYRRLLKYL